MVRKKLYLLLQPSRVSLSLCTLHLASVVDPRPFHVFRYVPTRVVSRNIASDPRRRAFGCGSSWRGPMRGRAQPKCEHGQQRCVFPCCATRSLFDPWILCVVDVYSSWEGREREHVSSFFFCYFPLFFQCYAAHASCLECSSVDSTFFSCRRTIRPFVQQKSQFSPGLPVSALGRFFFVTFVPHTRKTLL